MTPAEGPEAGARFGPYRFAPGVTGGQAGTLLVASFSTISVVTFLSFMSNYLVGAIGVPTGQQGALVGSLVSLQEIVQIALGGLVGAWSDRIGRRPLFVGGLLWMAAAYLVYPLAPSAEWLVALRGFYAIGMTAAVVMLTTCVAEYIDNRSRGIWMGTIGVTNGIGVVLMALVFAKLPLLFGRLGLDDVEALRASFWSFAALVVALALVVQRGLPAPAPVPGRRATLVRQAIEGLTVARENPRIALAYFTAFASRGDLVIVTTFISLWVLQAGTAAGMSLGTATARAGMVFGISQLAGLAWPLAIGFLLDRVPRLLGVSVAFGLAAAGYLLLGTIEDPLGRGMIAAVLLTGIGEASAIVSAGVLIGQEAPADRRGAVFGSYSLAGSIGQILLTSVGGLVFDRIGPHAPFVMMGIVNLAVMTASVVVYRVCRHTVARDGHPVREVLPGTE
jgi:MFS family permease